MRQGGPTCPASGPNGVHPKAHASGTTGTVSAGDQPRHDSNASLHQPGLHPASPDEFPAQLSPQRDDAGLHMPIRVFAMLPLDTVNSDSVFKVGSARWFKQALTVLAASGVHGVAVDVWWGAVERSPGCYSWAGYQQLVQLIKAVGLKMQAVMSFHACGGNIGDTAHIGLPPWVLQCGDQDPDLFFTDKPRGGLGQRNKEYISIWSSDERLLCGRTAYECYGDFMGAFKEAFAEDLGSTIEEVVIGSGPCGELRYPSYPERHGWRFPGIGEFQCYDRRALASLAAAAAAAGHPDWGYGGPHDAGHYNSVPEETGFFSFSGSWDTSYGRFFLSWYSSCLVKHGERLLQLANRTFASFVGVRGSGSSRAISQQLSQRSSRGNVDNGALMQASPSHSGTQPVVMAPATAPVSQQQPGAAAALHTMVLHPPPQRGAGSSSRLGGPGRVSASGVTGEALQGAMRLGQAVGCSEQDGSPTGLQSHSSAMCSSQESVRSSNDVCDSLHSNTPTSSCTAPLGHEPGLTSSSSSSYLCDPGVDVVGVVRGGPGGKQDAATGEGSGGGWAQQPPLVVLSGDDVPSTPPVHDLAVGTAPAGRTSGDGLQQQLNPGLCLQPQNGLQLPGFNLDLKLHQPTGNHNSTGGLMSPSFQLGGSNGGLLSPGFPGLSSPSFSQHVSNAMRSAPSMTLVARGSSNLPSNGASLSGSEGAAPGPSAPLQAGMRPSPNAQHSDVAGMAVPAATSPQVLLQQGGLGSPSQVRQLPRFMSCQAIATSGGSGAVSQLAQSLGSGPSLSTMSQPLQHVSCVMSGAGDPLQLLRPVAPAGQPASSQAGSTPVASPSTPTTTCGEHLATPLSQSSILHTQPMTVAQPPLATAAVALPDLARSVGQLSISSTSISTQELAELDDMARQQRCSMDTTSTTHSHSLHQHASSSSPAAAAGAADDAQLAPAGALQLPRAATPARHPVTLSLKIPGVHWWFRSRSHAAELTAGYYNTATRDGYAPVVELCARHNAALTLTCVEMCDGQHPAPASCSPEGLLKQIRALTARHNVLLSGENALPIFLGHGVDTVAMDRIVINTRAWYGPKAFTTAARQHAYLLALQQHSQPLPQPQPFFGTQPHLLPHMPQSQPQMHTASQLPDASAAASQQQQGPPYNSHPSYPPYTAGCWGDAATHQLYPGCSSYHLPPPPGLSSQVHDALMGRSFSDTGQLQYYQQCFPNVTGSSRQAGGGSQPSSQEPSVHGGNAVMAGGDSGCNGSVQHRHHELRSSPQIPDLTYAASLLLDPGSAGGGLTAGGGGGPSGILGGRAASAGGAVAMALDLPGEQRGVAACGLRTDSYADIEEPLPAMRSFTFLRLGPELLLSSYQVPWVRFMAGMQQGGYAPC